MALLFYKSPGINYFSQLLELSSSLKADGLGSAHSGDVGIINSDSIKLAKAGEPGLSPNIFC